MIVSISEFAALAMDQNGNVLPLGKQRLACQVRTTAGAFTALQAGTRFVRIATDTAIHMDIDGGSTNSSDELFVANSVEYIAVDGGETLTIAATA
jgi:hypothetical protein